MKKKIAIITGAGMSQESGISTFRDMDGLWKKFDPKIYASASSWDTMKDDMIEFYDDRRVQLAEVEPNEGHKNLAKLEEKYDVHIITQNVDDLHERAGSTKVMHIHGELTKIKPETELPSKPDYSTWINIGYNRMNPKEHQGYRPAVVWFGESVPKIASATAVLYDADILIVCGTSLQVYPAAGLVEWAKNAESFYLVDPNKPTSNEDLSHFTFIEEKASVGTAKLLEILM